jgi:hypothetical protein
MKVDNLVIKADTPVTPLLSYRAGTELQGMLLEDLPEQHMYAGWGGDAGGANGLIEGKTGGMGVNGPCCGASTCGRGVI